MKYQANAYIGDLNKVRLWTQRGYQESFEVVVHGQAENIEEAKEKAFIEAKKQAYKAGYKMQDNNTLFYLENFTFEENQI